MSEKKTPINHTSYDYELYCVKLQHQLDVAIAGLDQLVNLDSKDDRLIIKNKTIDEIVRYER